MEGTENLSYSDFGTTTDPDIVKQINEDYDSTLGAFLGENRTKIELGIVIVSTFFDSTPVVYEARTEVDNVEGLELLSVTNLNQL